MKHYSKHPVTDGRSLKYSGQALSNQARYCYAERRPAIIVGSQELRQSKGVRPLRVDNGGSYDAMKVWSSGALQVRSARDLKTPLPFSNLCVASFFGTLGSPED